MDECAYPHGILFQAPLILQIVHAVILPMIPADGRPDVVMGEVIDGPEYLTPPDLLLAPCHALELGPVMDDGDTPVQALHDPHSHQDRRVLGVRTVFRQLVHQVMEPGRLAGILLDGQRVLVVNPQRPVLRPPYADEVLLRGQGVCEFKWDLEPIGLDVRSLHDLGHVVHRGLPFGLLVQPEYLDRQAAQFLCHLQGQMEKHRAVLSARHTDDHVIVVLVQEPDAFKGFIVHVVLEVDHG